MILAVFKGFYPYFLPLVIYGIVLRIMHKEWTQKETVILLLLFIHAVLIFAQIIICRGDFSRRYFLPCAPLAFGWAGYALLQLFQKFRVLYGVLSVVLLFLVFDGLRPSLEHHWKRRKKEEYHIMEEMSSVIQKDWNKKHLYFRPGIWWYGYRSPKRPIVQCEDFPFLGYASGGRWYIPDSIEIIQPDYRIFTDEPVTEPYTEIYSTQFQGKIYRIGKNKND